MDTETVVSELAEAHSCLHMARRAGECLLRHRVTEGALADRYFGRDVELFIDYALDNLDAAINAAQTTE